MIEILALAARHIRVDKIAPRPSAGILLNQQVILARNTHTGVSDNKTTQYDIGSISRRRLQGCFDIGVTSDRYPDDIYSVG